MNRRAGPRLLDELHGALTRYVAFPSAEAADAAALWTTATHVQTAFEHATRLAALSPVKQCGKSRLLDVIEATSRNPMMTVNISAAALVRVITKDDPPTLLLDESDTVFGRNVKGDEKAEHLRGILNGGYQHNRPYRRYDASTRQIETCPTFAMAALAAIGELPDTITDRAVVIRMRRRAPTEIVASYRSRRDGPPLRDLGHKLGEWIIPYHEELSAAEPETGLDDRAHDSWEPLCAIAEIAGGDWPARALRAAKTLAGESGQPGQSAGADGMRLLADLVGVFGDRPFMTTAAILTALQRIEEAPWRDIYGRPLDARGIADRLRPFGVRSCSGHSGDQVLRGYRRADLAEQWTRYLEGSAATSATSATSQVSALHL